MSSIQQVSGNETVLRMDRCVRTHSDPQYERFFQELLQRSSSVVTLDLSRMERINPQTIRIILQLWERLLQSGRSLRLKGLQANVLPIFQRLKIDRYIRCLR